MGLYIPTLLTVALTKLIPDWHHGFHQTTRPLCKRLLHYPQYHILDFCRLVQYLAAKLEQDYTMANILQPATLGMECPAHMHGKRLKHFNGVES